jgi:hypothetical protein
MPELYVLGMDGAVRRVCGLSVPSRCDEDMLLISRYPTRGCMRGVRYGKADVVELLDDWTDDRLLESELWLSSRILSTIAGSSSVMPSRISAKTAIRLRNSDSARGREEKRAYSY